MTGEIKYLNKGAGYGYIQAEGIDIDLTLKKWHCQDENLFNELQPGQEVDFQIYKKDDHIYIKSGSLTKSKIIRFDADQLKRCYEFAKHMIGNHNPNMIMDRSDQEIFRDDFRGKLGEAALREYVKRFIPTAVIEGDIDYGVYERGKWDLFDLVINGKVINIKSIKQHSSYLMIEQYRFNPDGSYSYKNDDGSEVKVDIYILVRVTINTLDGRETKSQADGINIREDINTLVNEEAGRNPNSVYAEVLGGITDKDFWAKKHCAERGIPCTGKALGAVCMGEKVDKVNNPSAYKKTEILQQDNYIFSSKELTDVEKLL